MYFSDGVSRKAANSFIYFRWRSRRPSISIPWLTAPAKAVMAPTCMDTAPTVMSPAMALRPTKA